MVDAVTVIVDDQALAAYSIQVPPLVGDPGGFYPQFTSCYKTSMFIPLGEITTSWNWALEFEGTSVALFGVTPPIQYNQTIRIADPSVDKTNATQPNSYRAYTYPVSSQGGQFFTSGVVHNDSQIRIGLSNADGVAIDYALVTAGNLTNLQGQTILVDDRSSEIFWDGNWTMVDNYSLPVQCTIPSPQAYKESKLLLNSTDSVNFIAQMQPHANSTHSSNTVGDSFTFHFAGTSILVSGVTPGPGLPSDWLLHMEFVLDLNSTTRVFSPTSDPIKPHDIYFESTDLSPGNHILVGRILSVAGSPLPAAQIDYATYRPSFVTVAEKPVFPAPEVSGSATATSSSSIPTPNPSSATPSPSPSHAKSRAGAIVGAVIGGCILVGCFFGILWLVRRNQRRIRNAPNPHTEPFTSTAPTIYSEQDGPSSQLGTLPHSKRPFSPLHAASLSVASNSNSALSQQQNNIAAEIREPQNSPVDARLRELQAQMDAIEVRVRDNAPPSYSGEA
ncbi:Gpr1 family protein [Favolaschia claudopus]|uniref:Gpr1 family protein n=1 Tax=Favolaschia claudopus TaxID=2862362 RepID=A0AAW0AB20_9AGAR